MASEIKYEDYSDKVLSKMDNIIIAWLYEAAGELQAQVKRNTRVDTGQLKGSWDYKVNTIKHELLSVRRFKTLFGMNLERVNMRCTETVERPPGFMKMPRVWGIGPSVKGRKEVSLMPMSHARM